MGLAAEPRGITGEPNLKKGMIGFAGRKRKMGLLILTRVN
jgi:hypothetical protein